MTGTPQRQINVAAVVPAYQAERTIGGVVRELVALWPFRSGGTPRVIVVDDGSSDGTATEAARAGAEVIRHSTNRGKGAALRTGFSHARTEGADAAVTLDADGQHFAREAVRLAVHSAPREALILGVRDLVRDGAPRANRFSNGISNFFLSWLAGRRLHDTQCGLRRYPLPEVLELGALDTGYAFEAECIFRAARARWPLVEEPTHVFYPDERSRVTHFDSVRDPLRIARRLALTLLALERRRLG